MLDVHSTTAQLWSDPQTVLVGQHGCLDSMGFINFIVAVEDGVAQEFGLVLDLAEELQTLPSFQDGTLRIGDVAAFLAERVRKAS